MAPQGLRDIAGKGTFFNYVGKLSEGLAIFLIAVILSRGLSVDDFGLYSILMEILKFSVLLGSLGVPALFLRFLPEFIESNADEAATYLLTRGLLINVLALGVLVIGLTILAPGLAIWLKIPDLPRYLPIFCGVLVTHALCLTCNQAANSFLLQKYSNLIGALIGVAKLGLIFFHLSHGYGIAGVLRSLFLANVCGLVAYLVLLLRKTKGRWAIRWAPEKRRQAHRRFMRFGGFTYINESIAALSDTAIGVLVISVFLLPSDVALYSFAATTVALLMNWLPTRISSNLLLPLYVRQVDRQSKDPQEINYLFQLIAKTLGFLSIPTVAGLIILGPEIIGILFDAKFLPAYPVLVAFALFAAVNELLMLATLVAALKERTDIITWSHLFAVYHIGMTLLVVKPFGVQGVAWVNVTTLFAEGLFIYFWMRRITPLDLPYRALLRILLYTGIMSAGILLWKRWVPIENIGSLIVAVSIGAAIFFAVAGRWKVFAGRDREILAGLFGRIRFPF